jgi:TetR/AcrR family transcriptional regulator, regulator of cefoperazone and chloramphenicol sensitivity
MGMSVTASRHRPGTQVRGEETRRRILTTALEMFAAHGYDAVSTRLLADRAGINLPAIQYYFGSKEGLFRAVVAFTLEESEAFMAPVTANALALLDRSDATPAEMIDALCDIFERFVALVFSGEQVDAKRRLWARAEVEATPALQALQEGGRRQIFDPCLAVVARLFGRPTQDPAMAFRTLALFGQATIFCHVGIEKELGEGVFGDEHIAAIRALVRSQTQAILHAALTSPTEAVER